MGLFAKQVIGLDVDDGYVVASDVYKRGSRLGLMRCAVAVDLPGIAKEPLLKGAGVVINLPTQVILFRAFPVSASFVLKSKNKDKDIFAFLLKQNLPLKLEESFFSAFIVENQINLVAARKDVVRKYIGELEAGGLRVEGVGSSLIALYNVFIYNYPKESRAALINIRMSSTDLLFCDNKRLWIYPVSLGRRNFQADAEGINTFITEVQRTFNSHFLQNPGVAGGPLRVYLSGQEFAQEQISLLKKSMGDSEIVLLDPSRAIAFPPSLKLKNKEVLCLSLGLALTHLGCPGCRSINIISEDLKKNQQDFYLNLLNRSIIIFISIISGILLWLDITLFLQFKKRDESYRQTQLQVSKILPKVKLLMSEKEKIEDSQGFLNAKLNQNWFYLKALAVLAASKPGPVEIKEFVADGKDSQLNIFISGISPSYTYINDFLANLKADKSISEAKMIASTFPVLEDTSEAINFKLRFEIPAEGKPR